MALNGNIMEDMSRMWKKSRIVWHTLLFLISLSAAFAKQIHLVHSGSPLLQIRLFQTNCVRKRGVSQDACDACQVHTLYFFPPSLGPGRKAAKTSKNNPQISLLGSRQMPRVIFASASSCMCTQTCYFLLVL